MSSKIQATVIQPDTISVTLELTMTIGEWRKVMEALKPHDYWPCGRLAGMVRETIQKITNQVTDRFEVTP
jgi:hypothetical protein